MIKPSCSIVIPVYNEEKYLPILLTSIQNQTVKPKEVIVVDAYSKDKTETVAKSYRFVTLLKKKGGPAIQRNFGAKSALSKTLLFLDADVILPSTTFLEDSIHEIRKKKLTVASCFVEPLSPKRRDKVLHQVVNYYMKITKNFFLHAPGCCIFINKTRHTAIKGFDESLFLGEDHDYVQRAARKNRFSYLNSHRIFVSTRRLDREGRWTIMKKYFISELHLFFIGKIRRQLFLYSSN